MRPEELHQTLGLHANSKVCIKHAHVYQLDPVDATQACDLNYVKQHPKDRIQFILYTKIGTSDILTPGPNGEPPILSILMQEELAPPRLHLVGSIAPPLDTPFFNGLNNMTSLMRDAQRAK